MSLLHHIEYLNQASARAIEEEHQIKKKYHIDTTFPIDPLASHVKKWVRADRPEAAKIENYLNELDYDTLLTIQTLMYFGRTGRYDELNNRNFHLAHVGEPKDHIIQTIIQNRDIYPDYFRRALDKLKNQGVHIDSVKQQFPNSHQNH